MPGVMIYNGKNILRAVFHSSKSLLRSCYHIRTMTTELPHEDVIFQEIGKAGVMTMNRPKHLNGFNLLMIHSMTRQIEEFEKYKSLIITKSAVPKIFSAGGDIVKICELGKKKDKRTMSLPRYGYQLVHHVATSKIPYISFIDGLCMGGGAGISILGKYRVCTENTDFAMPEPRLGLVNDVGGSFYMSRLKNHLGFYLGTTGTRVKGYDNVHVGIATHFCPSEKLPELEKALGATNDIEATLDSLCSQPENSKFFLEPYVESIDRIFSSQSVEEILANLEKDGSPWAKKTIGVLRYVCPLALKANLHNLHRSKTASLEDCLQNEYLLATTFFQGENFFEGVRAHLKDKDNKPKWVPQRLEDVTQQTIEDLYNVETFLGPLEFRPIIRGKL